MLTSPTEPTPDADPVRAELKQLGYLENPLSRFFVGGGELGRRPAWRTHLRVGLGVGMVLGLLVALLFSGVFAATRPFAQPQSDTSIVFLLFVVLGVVVAFALGISASIAMYALFRWRHHAVDKAELAARSCGIAAFVLALAYFVLFWRHYGPGIEQRLGLPAVLFQGLAAVTSVAAAWWVAHVMRLSAYAVLATIPGFHVEARSRGSRAAWSLGLLFALIAAGFVVQSDARSKTPGFAAVGEPVDVQCPLVARVVLVAIDGLDHANVTDAIAQGWMPELEALTRRGFLRPLASGGEAIPPAFWTTVATGLSVERHRIDSYFRNRVLGLSQALDPSVESTGFLEIVAFVLSALDLTEEVPLLGSMSRVMRLSDVAARAGLPTTSVNFWATHPAVDFKTTTWSERAFVEIAAARRHAPADPDPAAFEPRTESAAACTLFDGLAGAVDYVPELEAAGLVGNQAVERPILYDAFVHSAALEQLARCKPAFAQVGLTGLDILRNELLRRNVARSDVRLDARMRVLEGYYRFEDRFLGELARAAGDDAWIVIVTHPGISSGSVDARGAIVVAGPHVAAPTATDVLPESIAPTLAFALGLPGSLEQDARADVRWFLPQSLAAAGAEPRMVAAFGLKPEENAVDPDDSSRRFLEFLAQNGYISR
ncbi:MAG: alkaline phosphatase family protein [Planctomycetes bacterium]|nr:alkaline phosphatase family protein [Planctomycetota bacterium]